MKKALALMAMISIVLSMFPLIVHVHAASNHFIHSSDLPQNPGLSSPSFPLADYIEQLGLTFTQNLTVITHNVTVSIQMDNNFYGPAYLVNGLTDIGYWYQAGLAWDLPYQNGTGLHEGFTFVYEVCNPSGASVYPPGGSWGYHDFLGPVNPGDTVMLKLSFSPPNVIMQATDLNQTGSSQSDYYNASYATCFEGLPSDCQDFNGYFSGIMTEWFHASPYSGNEAQVDYHDNGSALSTA